MDKATVTYLKRFDGDHPEREELAYQIYDELSQYVKCKIHNLNDIENNSEYKGILFSVGGDGALIGSTHTFNHKDNEFILVGTMGKSTAHYAETNFKKYKEDLKRLVSGNYDIKEATRVIAECPDYQTHDCLNEIAFGSQFGRTFNYELEVDTESFYKKYRGSSTSLLFATPSGSSAWSLSAGGPNVKIQGNIIITPESPIQTAKSDSKNCLNIDKDIENLLAPEVVPVDSKIELKLSIPTTMVEDGRWWVSKEFEKDTIIKIKEGGPIKLIELSKTYK